MSLIIGGYDDHTGPYLTSMDYLATPFEGKYVMQGFGGRFCNSILDNIYRESKCDCAPGSHPISPGSHPTSCPTRDEARRALSRVGHDVGCDLGEIG